MKRTSIIRVVAVILAVGVVLCSCATVEESQTVISEEETIESVPAVETAVEETAMQDAEEEDADYQKFIELASENGHRKAVTFTKDIKKKISPEELKDVAYIVYSFNPNGVQIACYDIDNQKMKRDFCRYDTPEYVSDWCDVSWDKKELIKNDDGTVRIERDGLDTTYFTYEEGRLIREEGFETYADEDFIVDSILEDIGIHEDAIAYYEDVVCVSEAYRGEDTLVADHVDKINEPFAFYEDISHALHMYADQAEGHIGSEYFRTDYEYDADGNIVKIYTRRGDDLRLCEEHNCKYEDNKLTEVEVVDKENPDNNGHYYYKRDGAGRLIEVNAILSDCSFTEKLYYEDNGKIIVRLQKIAGDENDSTLNVIQILSDDYDINTWLP